MHTNVKCRKANTSTSEQRIGLENYCKNHSNNNIAKIGKCLWANCVLSENGTVEMQSKQICNEFQYSCEDDRFNTSYSSALKVRKFKKASI